MSVTEPGIPVSPGSDWNHRPTLPIPTSPVFAWLPHRRAHAADAWGGLRGRDHAAG